MPKSTSPAMTGSRHLTHGECMALVRAARKATKDSYAPYSRYRVGAAVLSRNGQMWTGGNIENASYPLSLCAERTALARALAAGGSHLVAVAVTADAKATPWPCGACRQVIAELAPNAEVIVDLGGSTYQTFTVPELLPHAFTFASPRAKAKPAAAAKSAAPRRATTRNKKTG